MIIGSAVVQPFSPSASPGMFMAKSGTGPTIVPSGRTHVATIGSFTSTSAAHGSRESRNSCIQVLYIVAQSVSPSPPSSSTIGKSEPSGSRHGNAVSLEIGAFGSVIPSGQAVGSPVTVRHSGSGGTPPLRPVSSTSAAGASAGRTSPWWLSKVAAPVSGST